MKRVRVTIGGKVVEEVPLSGTVSIGRTDSNDVTIDDGQVSSRHAEVRLDGDAVFVKDVGSTNGSALDDGARLEANKEVPFGRGAKLAVGPAVIEVVDGAADDADTDSETREKTMVVGGGQMQSMLVNIARFKAAKPRLILAAEHERRVVEMEEMETTVGRDASSQLVINHASVSGKHATLNFVNGKFMLNDLKSSNGTFLDGNPVSAPTPLPVECAITFGTVDCLFVQKDADAGTGTGEDVHARALVAHAVKLGKCTEQQGREALSEHIDRGRSLGEVFVERGVISPKDWAELYRQRQIIGTLAPASTKKGTNPMVWVVIVLLVAALGAAAFMLLGK